MVIVYWEVEDPQRALRQLAESQDRFDVWFRQLIQNVRGIDMTREQPQTPELVFEWQAS
jgi:hypothetical protein